ncbi:MAG: 3-deoxy-8-phosphooctulonate synthase [Sediminibacterium sp.]|nr:3-deoxy-8-phosphooctulonate synthase [Sediminibacterium sp.]
MISNFKFLETLFSSQDYDNRSFFLIAGPCVVESEELCNQVAIEIKQICAELGIPFVFKSSYKKANRTSVQSFTGIGDINAMQILDSIKQNYNIPVLTDFHTEQEAQLAAKYVDILQVPAFLCRQTELLQCAAQTNRIINIKKGQFMSAPSMKFAVDKIKSCANDKIILTERGNSFGYQDLVVDLRNIKILQDFEVPVVMDCTHSNQQPNQQHGISLGTPQFIEVMARAAVANDVDGIFIETHPNPAQAKSDGANMLPLNKLKDLLQTLLKIRKAL